MPMTLFHYPVALGLSKLNKRLELPALIVGSFIPDIEVPFLIIFFIGVLPDHLVLHSFVGAVTIGTILSVIITVFLYPPLISILFGVDRSKLDRECRPTINLVFSCMLGYVFHILLDATMHPFSPILWPWVDPYDIVGPLVLLFTFVGDIHHGFLIANILTNSVMGVLELTIIIRYRKNLWEHIWIGKIDIISAIDETDGI